MVCYATYRPQIYLAGPKVINNPTGYGSEVNLRTKFRSICRLTAEICIKYLRENTEALTYIQILHACYIYYISNSYVIPKGSKVVFSAQAEKTTFGLFGTP